jgi:tRNA threonylcarbamoyl adenosine modification protein YeaZ
MNNVLPHSRFFIHDSGVKCLYLDLASHDGLIAGCDDAAVRALLACDRKISDDALLPLIEGVLKDAGWSFPDLTHISCVTGPGGFTSLRVGVTCANVLADQLGVPLAGVHLSDAWRAKTTGDMFWVHSTKKNELFARTFGDPTWPEPIHLSLEEFQQAVPKQFSWCGELMDEHRAILQTLGIHEVSDRKGEAGNWLPGLITGLSYQRELLLPWYGRGF